MDGQQPSNAPPNKETAKGREQFPPGSRIKRRRSAPPPLRSLRSDYFRRGDRGMTFVSIRIL